MITTPDIADHPYDHANDNDPARSNGQASNQAAHATHDGAREEREPTTPSPPATPNPPAHPNLHAVPPLVPAASDAGAQSVHEPVRAPDAPNDSGSGADSGGAEAVDPEAALLADADKAAARAVKQLRDRTADLISWLVAAAAGLLSLTGFDMFGRHVQWPAFTTPAIDGRSLAIEPMLLLWVAIDLLAIIAMRQWMRPDYGPDSRRLGKWASIGALSISIVINVAGHTLEGGPHWWVSIPASAIPPGLLYVALLLRDRRIQEQAAAARAARLPYERRAERLNRTVLEPDTPTRPRHKARTHGSTNTQAKPRTAKQADQTAAKAATDPARYPVRDAAHNGAQDSTPKSSNGSPDTQSSDVRVALVDLLAREPGLTQKQLAARLGVTDRTIRRHMLALDRDDQGKAQADTDGVNSPRAADEG